MNYIYIYNNRIHNKVLISQILIRNGRKTILKCLDSFIVLSPSRFSGPCLSFFSFLIVQFSFLIVQFSFYSFEFLLTEVSGRKPGWRFTARSPWSRIPWTRAGSAAIRRKIQLFVEYVSNSFRNLKSFSIQKFICILKFRLHKFLFEMVGKTPPKTCVQIFSKLEKWMKFSKFDKSFYEFDLMTI